MGAITYAQRASLITLLDRAPMPEILRCALRFVPAAVLSAIIVPEVLAPRGALELSLANPRIASAAVAVVIAWRTRSVLATIGVGMAVLWLLRGLAARV
jgi:branched-subunit amino acid transport protein